MSFNPDVLISEDTLHDGVVFLGEVDSDLRRITDKLGDPPIWVRPTGFATLIQIILEQQVSLASAKAVNKRLTESVDILSPEAMLHFSDNDLRGFGLSRQKTGYCRNLALVVKDGRLNLDDIGNMPDSEVRSELSKLKGIGIWSADIYLLMALRRPDVLPQSDIALIIAMQALKKLPHKPSQIEFQEIGKAWKPWRSVGARVLWNYYLNRKIFG